MQSLGKIEQHAPAVGEKIWCLYVFVCLSPSEAGALFVRQVHSLNKYCVMVYQSILTQISPFSEEIALSDALHSFRFRQ